MFFFFFFFFFFFLLLLREYLQWELECFLDALRFKGNTLVVLPQSMLFFRGNQHLSGNEFGLLRISTLHGNKESSSKENLGFPDSSVGKESPCNAGDPSSIPGSGRSTGEGIGYPLQHSGLENSMDCIVRGDRKKSDTTEWLSLSFYSYKLIASLSQ